MLVRPRAARATGEDNPAEAVFGGCLEQAVEDLMTGALRHDLRRALDRVAILVGRVVAREPL